MRRSAFVVMAAMLVAASQATVLVYEGFGDIAAGQSLAGYSGTSAESGLGGTWNVTTNLTKQYGCARTTYEYVGVSGGYAPDTVGDAQHWWEHNRSWALNQAERSLLSSIDMSVDGTTYMSFSAMAGDKDVVIQMGLNDGTNELMFGNGYNGVGVKGLTAYYGAIGTWADTNGNGTSVTGFNNGGKYETGFFVAKLEKSNSGVTDDLAVSIMFYNLGNLDAPSNTIDGSDPIAWTRVVNLTGVTGSFTNLELKLDGGNSWPSIDEVRIGQSWSDVTIPEPATLVLLGLGSLVLGRKR